MKSYQDWLKEFYPISAEAAARNDEATDLDLIRHSLQKWKGLNVIDGYNVNMGYDGIYMIITDPSNPDDGFDVSGESCALCERHHAPREYDEDGNILYCNACPFMVVFGTTCGEDIHHPAVNGSPWRMWVDSSTAAPMIRALTVLETHYMKLEETK